MWNDPTYEYHPLTLSSPLRGKELTRRCYICNDKDYKLALILLNFYGGTKPTNRNHTCHMDHKHNYYMILTTRWGVTQTDPSS